MGIMVICGLIQPYFSESSRRKTKSFSSYSIDNTCWCKIHFRIFNGKSWISVFARCSQSSVRSLCSRLMEIGKKDVFSKCFKVALVFARCSKARKKASTNVCKCLIINVDQLGLEPRTSRLWVCCSNQLSYKSKRNGFRYCECKCTIFW